MAELEQFCQEEWDNIPPKRCERLHTNYCKCLIWLMAAQPVIRFRGQFVFHRKVWIFLFCALIKRIMIWKLHCVFPKVILKLVLFETFAYDKFKKKTCKLNHLILFVFKSKYWEKKYIILGGNQRWGPHGPQWQSQVWGKLPVPWFARQATPLF